MKKKRLGSRHTLLMYRRTSDRMCRYSLALGLFLAASVRWTRVRGIEILGLNSEIWLIAGSLIALFISLLALMGRSFAYVRAGENHLMVTTPLLRFKIAYRRIHTTYPALAQQLFPPENLNWAERSFLEPFHGKTALVVNLRGFPLNKFILQFFLPSKMFSPRSKGLIFFVPDWVKFSTELDSLYGAWLQTEWSKLRLRRSG